jgi:lysophospholipase L1-like esterase
MKVPDAVKHSLLVLVSLLVVAAILEIGLRAYYGVPLLSFPNFVADRVDIFKVESWAKYDSHLGWITTPDQGAADGAPITTDKYGDRMPSNTVRPLPQRAILAVGDSFTFGTDVNNEESWPAILERLSGRAVVNAATAGWATDQIVLHAEEMLDRVHPTVVIVSFHWHDILRAGYETFSGANKPYFTVRDSELVLHNVPVPAYAGNVHEVGLGRAVLGYSYLVFWTMERLGYQDWVNSWRLKYKKTPEADGVDISCRLLRRIKQEAAERQVRLIFLMQYWHDELARKTPPAPASAVVNCARAEKIETFDTWSKMKQIGDEDPDTLQSWFMHSDGRLHMSPLGNEFIAKELKARLDKPSDE